MNGFHCSSKSNYLLIINGKIKMLKLFIRNYLLCIIGTSTFAMATQAPMVTDKDIVEELFLNFDRTITLRYMGKEIKADYVEEGESITSWSQGKKAFSEKYLQPLTLDKIAKTPAKVLNIGGTLIKVTADNSGKNKTFAKLTDIHYGKMACRYSYTVPKTTARIVIYDGQGIYQDVTRMQTDLGATFIINLIFKPEDVGISSTIAAISIPSVSTSIPLRSSIPISLPSYTNYPSLPQIQPQPTISAPISIQMQLINYTYEPGTQNKNVFYQLANGQRTGVKYIKMSGGSVWHEYHGEKKVARHTTKPF